MVPRDERRKVLRTTQGTYSRQHFPYPDYGRLARDTARIDGECRSGFISLGVADPDCVSPGGPQVLVEPVERLANHIVPRRNVPGIEQHVSFILFRRS